MQGKIKMILQKDENLVLIQQEFSEFFRRKNSYQIASTETFSTLSIRETGFFLAVDASTSPKHK